MPDKKNAPPQETALMAFVKQNCQYYLSDECYGSLSGKCIGGNVNSGKLKRESQAAVIHQYPIEFPAPNTGECWIQEGISCDYFLRRVLPIAKQSEGSSALVDEYEKLCKSVKNQKVRYCNCGNKIDSNERKCTTCKAGTRKLRNRRFRRDG